MICNMKRKMILIKYTEVKTVVFFDDVSDEKKKFSDFTLMKTKTVVL